MTSDYVWMLKPISEKAKKIREKARKKGFIADLAIATDQLGRL